MKNAIETQSEATKRETERLNRVADAKGYTLPPCPDWCAWSGDALHKSGATDSLDDGTDYLRNHETAPIGVDPYSFVISNEQRIHANGSVETSAPYIYLHIEYEHMTAEQSRDFGALLLTASAWLDEVTAGVVPKDLLDANQLEEERRAKRTAIFAVRFADGLDEINAGS